MPVPMIAVTTAIYTAARLGQADALTNDIATVLGREPVPFEHFAHDHAATWTSH